MIRKAVDRQGAYAGLKRDGSSTDLLQAAVANQGYRLIFKVRFTSAKSSWRMHNSFPSAAARVRR